MTDSPLITIGLPVYNSERYLTQSLDSLLAQTYRDFVLVISDNASTDRTAEICRSYAEADRRVQYFRNDTNIGNPRNFNRVCSLVTTKYLKWSTSDDLWAPDFLERALEIMERDPTVAVCHPQAYLVDADGGILQAYDDDLHLVQEDPADRFIALLERIKLAHQHLGLIRMSDLGQAHLLGTHVGSDYNLLAELTLYGKFYQLPERLFFRRFHEKSGSWKRGDAKHEAATYHAAANAARFKATKWPRHVGFFSAVNRAPLPIRTKAKLYRFLSRRMLWDRSDLFHELVQILGSRRYA
jgi:glycosyltransferase involved in cell wall biosynthesis